MEIEDQDHIINCPDINVKGVVINTNRVFNFDTNCDEDMNIIKSIHQRLNMFEEAVEELIK